MKRPDRRSVAVFLAGVLVGGVLAAVGVSWIWNRQFEDWYVLEVADNANVAKEIYLGHSQELADRIRLSLPEYARHIETDFADSQWSAGTLWLIADVFEASDTKPPPEVERIIDSLPPRESCPAPPPEQ